MWSIADQNVVPCVTVFSDWHINILKTDMMNEQWNELASGQDLKSPGLLLHLSRSSVI